MKVYKPTTPGRRKMTGSDFGVLTKKEPEKSLILPLKKKGGRSKGRITVRHRGGGAKKKYRIIDFSSGQDKLGISVKVLSLEYDPCRTSFIGLVQYPDGEKRYILAPQDLKVGDEIVCKEKAEFKAGNRMKLKNIIIGMSVYNIELIPGKGGQIVRSAGVCAKILAREGGYVNLVLPSTEIRKVPEECFASIGSLSRPEHTFVNLGKAGKKRYLGIRPHVRGSAMNPRDHPHGGGEGRTSIGLKHPKTPWGKPALGVKTRKKRKYSNKFVVRRRKKKKKK